MKSKEISFEEFQQLGKKYYSRGGSFIVECWEDYQFNDWCKMFGPMTEQDALNMIGLYDEEEREAESFRKWASGEPEKGWWEVDEDEDGENRDPFVDWDDGWNDDFRSSCNGDYGPSAPWNAPGMSVHDFI